MKRTPAKNGPIYDVVLLDRRSGLRSYLVIDSIVKGIAGGGLRMTPNVTREEVRRLARTMKYKWAAMGLPFGGAKIGIVAQPYPQEKKKLLRSFGKLAKPFLREIMFTGPDMGVNYQDLQVLFEEVGTNTVDFVLKKLGLKKKVRLPSTNLSSLAGKDFEEKITGWGVYSATDEACSLLDLDLEEATVSIQGFGVVGKSVASYLYEKGARIICISDLLGAVYNKKGIEIPYLLRKGSKGGLIDRTRLSSRTQFLDGIDWLNVGAEILIPAAIPDAINRRNVGRVQASLVVEAANLPISPWAEGILSARGIVFVPDFISNAGLACGFGIIVTGAVPPKRERAFEEVAKRIREATSSVVRESLETGQSPRELAIQFARQRMRKIKLRRIIGVL